MKTYRLTFGEVNDEGRILKPIFVRAEMEDPTKEFWKLTKLMEAKIAVRQAENDPTRT